MIAALFVEKDGPYYGLPDVDPWPEERDARKYAGPHPVVAHPPCERWGRYHSGGPSAKVRRFKGQDGGCFYVALWAVRTFGGVLEHPADTAAYPYFGLIPPPKDGGWVAAGDFTGWVCHVEQGHYGHPARKATWLYAVADDLPSLRWGPSGKRTRCDEGFHSKDERARARAAGVVPVKRLSKTELVHTPLPFRNLMLRVAGHSPSALNRSNGSPGAKDESHRVRSGICSSLSQGGPRD